MFAETFSIDACETIVGSVSLPACGACRRGRIVFGHSGCVEQHGYRGCSNAYPADIAVVTVSDVKFALSTSESVASASAISTGPPFSVKLVA